MAKLDVQSFELLARLLGAQGAGEVLLLAVATVCGRLDSIWMKARGDGIPWLRKNWTALSQLQEQYNHAVETALAALPESEESIVWADRTEESESLVSGNAASAVASRTPSMPTYARIPQKEIDISPYAPRPGLGSAAAPARLWSDLDEQDHNGSRGARGNHRGKTKWQGTARRSLV